MDFASSHPTPRPWLLSLIIAVGAMLTLLLTAPLAVQVESFVILASYDGVINPVSAEYLHNALISAQESGVQGGKRGSLNFCKCG